MMNNDYDIILVGGGIANIALAVNLMNTKYKVLLIEMGKDLANRVCPKAKAGRCVNCQPCSITSGFSGAGCFSDCKLTYSSEVGGTLIDNIGVDAFDRLLQKADQFFTDFGGSQDMTSVSDYADNLQAKCLRYGMKLLKFPVRHLGTDGSYKVMLSIRGTLEKSSNITVLCNQNVRNIDFECKEVFCEKNSYKCKYISVAVGRSGSDWLRHICINQGIDVINGTVDIGVRVECPRIITDDVTDNLYEFKIINYSNSENKVRTFCVNPGGYVVQENYNDCICVNGHSLSDNKSLTTNFALLVTCNFTEPFNEPIQYGKSICHLANMLAGNKPLVQRLIDLKSKKRSTESRLQRLSYEPTLKETTPGDFRYVFPANVLDSIIETLDNLNNVMPGINGKETILYGPEVKFYSSKIKLNDKLQTSKYEDIYFIGDSSGVTHGIMQSVMSGIYVAEQLLQKEI